MTDMRMALAELLEKGSDADLLREMVAFVAQGFIPGRSDLIFWGHRRSGWRIPKGDRNALARRT